MLQNVLQSQKIVSHFEVSRSLLPSPSELLSYTIIQLNPQLYESSELPGKLCGLHESINAVFFFRFISSTIDLQSEYFYDSHLGPFLLLCSHTKSSNQDY